MVVGGDVDVDVDDVDVVLIDSGDGRRGDGDLNNQ